MPRKMSAAGWQRKERHSCETDEWLEKHDKKGNRVFVPTTKVTEAELQRRREAEMQKKAEETMKRQNRMTTKEEYARTVLVKNANRNGSIVDAQTVKMP